MAKGKNGKGSRKSKAEGATGAKAAAAEMRAAGELDLVQVEIDDGDFDLHFRGAKSAKQKMEQYQSAYRSALKSAKKVSEELLDAVKRALKFEAMSAEDIKRQLEIDGYVLRRQGSPVQLTIHDTLAGDPEKQAYDRGKHDQQNGQVARNPYPDGSSFAEQYSLGYRNALSAHLGVKEDADEGDPPEPRTHARESSLVQ